MGESSRMTPSGEVPAHETRGDISVNQNCHIKYHFLDASLSSTHRVPRDSSLVLMAMTMSRRLLVGCQVIWARFLIF